MASRREFLVGCSSAIAAMAGARFGSLAFANDGGGNGDRILVALFLRGGMDGLNLLAPVNDKDYRTNRKPGTRVEESGKESGISIGNLPQGDGWEGLDFRLHPSAGGLKELYDSKALGFLHASGITNGTRSHFDAQDLIDFGIEDLKDRKLNSGWISRLAHEIGLAPGLMPTASVSDAVAKSLLGSGEAISVPHVRDFGFVGADFQKKALESIYSGQSPLHLTGQQSLLLSQQISDRLAAEKAKTHTDDYVPGAGIHYPNGELADALKNLARLIKFDVGLQFATVDFGGWDTHVGQQYQFGQQVAQLSNGLSAFWNDMAAYHNRLTVVVVSEFGRRFKENESGGTDHGHGNVMLALGAHVNGGKLHGRWPGLATEQLDQHADLAVTTDYRFALAELISKKYGVSNPTQVFPGLKGSQAVGLFS